jgi:hypothetical protein
MTWLAGRSATDGTGGGDAAGLSCFISGVFINQTTFAYCVEKPNQAVSAPKFSS